jgi:hygromycin-B 4-O-kinase
MVELDEIKRFLRQHLDADGASLRHIGEGMFSQAYAFSLGPREYVLRLNTHESDFHKDLYAYAHYRTSRLPIPRPVQMGVYRPGQFYMITGRCAGRNLDQRSADEVRPLVSRLFDVLDIIHETDVTGCAGWGLTDTMGHGRFASWPAYLMSLYNQKYTFDWRSLAKHACLDGALYAGLFDEMRRLTAFCPQDRHLIHGDFGFDNVMSDGNRITGVLDWAECALGDPVYDVAYLDFWSKSIRYGALWHDRALSRGRNLRHFEERMRCYMLHIGLAGMAIAAHRGDERDYVRVRERTLSVLLPGRHAPTDWTQ